MTRRFAVTAALAILANGACNSPYSPSNLGTPPGTGKQGALKLDASFIEYDGAYAPQMRVTEISRVGGVTLTNVRFDIAGFPNIWDCRIDQRLAPGESRELFHEIYGDYPLSFDHGQLGSPGPVGVVLSYVD